MSTEERPPDAAETLPAGAEDPSALARDLRDYLKDLIAFEGADFIAPAASSQVELPGLNHRLPAIETAAPGAAEEGPGDRSIPLMAPSGEIDRAAALQAFERQICACTECGLGKSRTKFVFGSGNPEAGIMFIGEAPGAEEDRQGLPFVGEAGRLLTKIIEAIRLQRQDVYICNVLKCRPPNNRDPRPDEVQTCEPYLKRQIEIIQPKVICSLGRFATQTLLRTSESMGRLRGRTHEYQGIPVIPTYHPAALLRNPQWKRPAWEDMKRLRREFDGTEL